MQFALLAKESRRDTLLLLRSFKPALRIKGKKHPGSFPPAFWVSLHAEEPQTEEEAPPEGEVSDDPFEELFA